MLISLLFICLPHENIYKSDKHRLYVRRLNYYRSFKIMSVIINMYEIRNSIVVSERPLVARLTTANWYLPEILNKCVHNGILISVAYSQQMVLVAFKSYISSNISKTNNCKHLYAYMYLAISKMDFSRFIRKRKYRSRFVTTLHKITASRCEGEIW